jgi:lysozyme
MKFSEEGFKILEEEEGWRENPYLCPAGVPTIGYGSTVYEDGTPVKLSDPAITEERGKELVNAHFKKSVYPAISLVKVPLSQNQFDALCDIVYNIGIGNFSKSTLLKKVNAADWEGAAAEFKKWNMGGGKVLPGLVRRREKEAKLFLKK